ncbi:MAG: FtsX-like permease family protein [Anaerolineae bacterium]|jgi:putative ABC transport system permease protein
MRSTKKQFGPLWYALQRLRSRSFLNILIALSMAIIVAIMAGVPVFSEGVSRLILREELNVRTQSLNRPPFSVRYYGLPKSRMPLTIDSGGQIKEWLADTLRSEVGLPVAERYAQYQSPPFRVRIPGREYRAQDPDLATLRIALVDDIENRIDVVAGAPFGQIDDPNVLNVWITREMSEALAMQVGETLDMAYFFRSGVTPIKLRIVGFWEATDPMDPYWYWEPAKLFQDVVITTREQYETFVSPVTPEGFGFAFWYFVMDDGRMALDDVPRYIKALETIEGEVAKRIPDGKMDYSPGPELIQAQSRKTVLSDTLLTFALPLMGILASFIASVSFVTARFQVRETAMVRSRGTSRTQLMVLSLLETVLILAIAVPVGLALGLALARLMGYSYGFLQFVNREPLQVNLIAASPALIAIALLVSTVSRLLPVWLATRFSIVTYEQRHARSSAGASIARVFLLLFLGLVTYYAYYQLHQGGPLSLMGYRGGTDQGRDPLLILAPTLFLFSSSLLASELFILLMRPLALVARFLPSTPLYFGWTSLVREGQHYRTPVFLLVLCLNLGVFYASLAKSADIWMVDRLRYQVGADLTFEHLSTGDAGASGLIASDAWLLPASAYKSIAGVGAATRVARFQSSLSLPRGTLGSRPGGSGEEMPEMNLLLVDRMEFPSVVYWRRDFAPQSLGSLMNLLGATPNGLLVQRAVAERLPEGAADELPIDISLDGVVHTITFRVVGVFDYWPTMPQSNPVYVVGNMEYIEREIGGAFPHGIWMRLNAGADPRAILDGISAMQVTPARPVILSELVAKDQQNLERIGIFGLLTVCFLTGALLSGTELLIYSYANLTGRTTRYAMLRAIGMRGREIVGIVSSEYMLVLLYGVVAGIIVGVTGAQLYVPYFPLTQDPASQIPPFLPVVDWLSTNWMAAGVALALIVIGGAILSRVVRQQLFQVLRMGNQE